jgi:DNA-binding XRE family transcriptional regulator
MGRSLREIKARMPGQRRRTIEKRTVDLIAEEMSLRDLRRALQLTQTDLAEALGKRQDEVSRIEQRGDLLLSTLQAYVASLGGELELVCTFKDRGPVRIKPAGSRIR